jgi:two-component system chemotaxis response regulator CheB
MRVEGEVGVLVVEDSLVTRRFLIELIREAPGLYVVGEAADGDEAVEQTRRLHPDVISMDINMPSVSGLEATRRIMADAPTPIVVVSASLRKREVDMAFEALQAGAMAVVEKPPGRLHPDFERKRQEMLSALRLMARAQQMRDRAAADDAPGRVRKFDTGRIPKIRRSAIEVVAIGASAGGPAALTKILSALPADFEAAVLVVQHLATEFVPGFAQWLDRAAPMVVRVGEDGAVIRPGTVYIAPGGVHMAVNGQGYVRTLAERGEHRHQPSVTVLFESVAESYGPNAIGVILTGMGDDGAAGLYAMRKAGAFTLAQDEASCVVFGMPAVAIAQGAVKDVVPLDRLAKTIQGLVRYKV